MGLAGWDGQVDLALWAAYVIVHTQRWTLLSHVDRLHELKQLLLRQEVNNSGYVTGLHFFITTVFIGCRPIALVYSVNCYLRNFLVFKHTMGNTWMILYRWWCSEKKQ